MKLSRPLLQNWLLEFEESHPDMDLEMEMMEEALDFMMYVVRKETQETRTKPEQLYGYSIYDSKIWTPESLFGAYLNYLFTRQEKPEDPEPTPTVQMAVEHLFQPNVYTIPLA